MTNWSGGKSLSLDQMTYENWLDNINQKHPVDLGDWEEYVSDYDLGIDQGDFQDDEEEDIEEEDIEEGEEPQTAEDKYLEARREAYGHYIKSRFNDWVWKYKSWKYPLTLYRAVCLKSYDELKRDELGTDWSDDKDSAQCYHKHLASGEDYYIIVAEVGKDDIDWAVNMVNNLNPSFGEAEQEVNLLPGRKVKVVKVEGPDDTEEGFTGNVGRSETTAKLLTVLSKLVTQILVFCFMTYYTISIII